MKYRPEIDGLRALAVMPVILFHAGFEWFSGGFIGVDIFFVISGYLISSIIINELSLNEFSILNFYERRARRILPALFFVVGFCIPFSYFLLPPLDLKDFGQSLIAVSTFLSNFLFWSESGYFETAAELKPLLHTWSLAVEEQFYILFPLILISTWRFGTKWTSFILFIIFILSLSLAHWSTLRYPSSAFYLLHTRMWELLLGVFTAIYLKSYPLKNLPVINQSLSIIGFCMIIYSIIAFDKTTPFPGFYALVPTVGTVLLIVFAVPRTAIYKVLSFKPIVGIGLISYSAYLWHQPLLAFSRHQMSENSQVILLLICIISIVFAWFSWHFIEKPFRNKNSFDRKQIFSFAFLGIFAFSTLGFIFHSYDGFPNRVNSEIDINTIKESPLRSKCHSDQHDPINRKPCEYFGDRVEWATFGDSHVVEISYALAEKLKIQNKGVQHNSFSGCEPSLLDSKSDCHEWTKKTLNRLINSEKIKNVVVSFRLTVYMFGESLGSYSALPNKYTDQKRQKIWDDLIKILDMLAASGKQVYFIVQPPELPENIYKMVFLNNAKNKIIKGVSRDWWKKRNSFVTERINEVSKDITVVDITDSFCDESFCYGNDINGYFYFDDDHVSLYGASILVEEGIFQSN